MKMERLILYATVAVLAIALIGAAAWNFDPFGRRKRLEQQVAVAVPAAKVAEATVKTLDTYHTSVITIREKAEQNVEAVRALPGAATPLDPVRRAGLCAAISGMRNGAPACTDLHSDDATPAMLARPSGGADDAR